MKRNSLKQLLKVFPVTVADDAVNRFLKNAVKFV